MSSILKKVYPYIYLLIPLFTLLFWKGEYIHETISLFIILPWFFWTIVFIIIAFFYGFIQKENIFFLLIIIFTFSLPFLITIQPNQRINIGERIYTCSLNSQFLFGYLLKDSTKIEIINDKLKEIKAMNCDVILLQEVWNVKRYFEKIEPTFAEVFPEFFFAHGGEFITISRFPIKSQILGYNEGFLKTTIILPTQKDLSIYNVHLWNPLFTRNCISLEGFVNDANPCMISAFDIRKAQSQELLLFTRNDDDPQYIAGDFNSMQQTDIIQKLSKERTLISQSNIGLKATFPASFPLLSIDYQFITEELTLLRQEIYCNPNISDHCMISTEISLP